MWAICVHELKRIWAFSLDENHFEIYKVMTLTFELENGNHTYLIKLWYILYLNTKFGGCSLKAVYVANIYITLPQRRKNQWPLVTLTFEMRSTKKTLYIPGYVLDICAKNDADPDSGLGGVCKTSYTQTDGFTLLWYRWFIKKDNSKSLFFHNEKLKNTIHTSNAQCQVYVIFQMQSLV